jgi:hypothetical protein
MADRGPQIELAHPQTRRNARDAVAVREYNTHRRIQKNRYTLINISWPVWLLPG